MEEPLLVTEQFRTHHLSLIEGGTEVVVKYFKRSPLKYDKVKNVQAYIKSVLSNHNDVEYILVKVKGKYLNWSI